MISVCAGEPVRKIDAWLTGLRYPPARELSVDAGLDPCWSDWCSAAEGHFSRQYQRDEEIVMINVHKLLRYSSRKHSDYVYHLAMRPQWLTGLCSLNHCGEMDGKAEKESSVDRLLDRSATVFTTTCLKVPILLLDGCEMRRAPLACHRSKSWDFSAIDLWRPPAYAMKYK